LRWHAKIQPDQPDLIVVIAACARPYVIAAAQSGYNIAAFDMFHDADTRRFCVHSARVKYADGGFDAHDLLHQLSVLDVSRVQGVTYGSGFEGQPELLAEIAKKIPLLGNTPETLEQVKNPKHFFPLLDTLQIAHPEISLHAPSPQDGWLIKSAGGSGGTHIRQAWQDIKLDDYFQCEVTGRSISVLFLADGNNIQAIGYNEQWCSTSTDMPYRYGGAVSRIELPIEITTAMDEAARKITAAVGLKGLNSADFILTEHGLLLLEINPRLSATLDLYQIPDLFERHVQACRGKLTALLDQSDIQAKAHCILYASQRLHIPEDFVWPEWSADIPHAGPIQQHAPVCTAFGQAPLAEDAKSQAFARMRELEAQLSALQS
jgi:predicted ATP-grasp superfamily ATP-dependent carboligase